MRGAASLLVLTTMTACLSSSQPDGQLDCATDVTWSGFATPEVDAVGSPTPSSAIEDALSPHHEQHGGEDVFVAETHGSLVIDGAEVVIVYAAAAPAGGWVVNTTTGCEEFTG